MNARDYRSFADTWEARATIAPDHGGWWRMTSG